jgi:hypothetical protein
VVRRSIARGLLATVLVASVVHPAAAQTIVARSTGETELSRFFAGLPGVIESLVNNGYRDVFRLLQTLEIFHFEAEIDRFVGKPQELNDATNYKLTLLPFYVAYPIYQPLVAQMTRLDSVRANRIYTVTPDSVSLVDLRLRPVATLQEFSGLGRDASVATSLVSNLSARDISDLTVLLLAQQPFFPATDADWQHSKHNIARAAVPIALAALATGAFFDAGSLVQSGPIVRRGKDFELRYYGQFRDLGVHWHPYLRGGVATRAYGFEAAAGLADQVNATVNQPDRAVELALREGWLNQLVQPLGLDAFFEAALKRSIGEQAGFVGDRTTARTGFFFKRDQAPLLRRLAMRGSIEAETNLQHRLHLTTALGFEKPHSGITTVLQANLIPAAPKSGLPDEAQLNLFFVGAMEPLSQSFADDMTSLARLVVEEWAGLQALEKRRADWEQELLTNATMGRTPQNKDAMLGAIEQIVIEREQRTVRLAADLADYLESRRRAYAVLNRPRSPDDLHGPLDAGVLIAARTAVLSRLQQLSGELASALDPLVSPRDRLIALRREVEELELAAPPASPLLEIRRQELAVVEGQWEHQADRIRRYLAARDQLYADGVRILTAMGQNATSIRQWDSLGALVRTRVARLAISAPP